jgi:hypothetical protein
MTINFENDKDIIIHALEKIISYARSNQYIFLSQSVWWISSIIGLQQGLVIHVDNIKIRENIGISERPIESRKSSIHRDRIARIQYSGSDYTDSELDSVSTTETDIHNEVIDNCEVFLEQSRQERKAIR